MKNSFGWGIKDGYFFYNPDDLKNMTDDQVLGKILQQMAKIVTERPPLSIMGASAQNALRLFNALEDSRATRYLERQYPGVPYYHRSAFEIDSQDMLSDPENEAKMFRDNIPFVANDAPTMNNSPGFLKAQDLVLEYIEQDNANPLLFAEIRKHYPDEDGEEERDSDSQSSNAMRSLSQRYLDELVEESKGEDALDEEGGNTKSHLGRYASKESGDPKQNENLLATYKEIASQRASQISTIVQSLKSILVDNKTKRYISPFKRGKLNPRSLYKLITSNNMRVFKQPKALSDKDYAVSVLVDRSGSMDGYLAKIAVEASIVLIETLEKLKVPYMVIGYSSTAYIFKKFQEKLFKPYIPCLNSYYDGRGTNDTQALKITNHQIKTNINIDTTKNIVFVVTDGEGYYRSAREEVQKLEKDLKAKVFGVGIGAISEDSLKKVYDHYVKIEDVTELPSVLIKLMRSQFKRQG
jgi:hypothetical protein